MARRPQTLADMVRTLVVFGVVVGGAFVLVPHNRKVQRTPVDYREPVAALAARSPFRPLIPVGLPPGWAANHVRTHASPVSIDIGFYDAPDRAYLSLHETAAPQASFLKGQGVSGPSGGTVTASGLVFEVRHEAAGPAHTALVANAGSGATLLLGGGASLPLLVELADQLRPTVPTPAR